MTSRRDVSAFDKRAGGYDAGWLGRFHHDLCDATLAVAHAAHPHPRRILDVGCGTGYLLAAVAEREPSATRLAGVDAAAAMIEVATRHCTDPRVTFQTAAAEALPFEAGSFDLVVSTTSFDHWGDQRAGLRECARVLDDGGHLVLADLVSPVLAITLLGRRSGKARTRGRMQRLLAEAGFAVLGWHHVGPMMRAVVAQPVP